MPPGTPATGRGLGSGGDSANDCGANDEWGQTEDRDHEGARHQHHRRPGACAGIITARVKPGDDDEAECGHER